MLISSPASTYRRTENMKPVAEPTVISPIVPRLLRIADAAQYLSSSYGFVETLVREKRVPSMMLGKRRVIDIRDLDSYIDQIKERLSE
jgi:excisionase family DNA binding protein